VVTGVEAFGLFAQGIEIPAEGLIPILKLPQDRYKFDKTSKSLTGFRSDNQFRLGDMVEVQVDLVDMDKRIMEFKLVRSLSAAEDNSGGKGRSATTDKPKKSEKSAGKQKAKGAAPFEGAQVGPSRKQKEKQKQKKLDEKKKAKAKPKSKKDKDKKAKAKKEKAAKKKSSKDKSAKDKSGKKSKDKAKKKKKQKKKDLKANKPKKAKDKKKKEPSILSQRLSIFPSRWPSGPTCLPTAQ